MKILFALLALFVYSKQSLADHGIHFKAKEVAKEYRTGLDITHKNNISYSTSFAIEFNLSLKATDNPYGEVLSLKEINGNNLIQVTYQEPELYVIHNKRETKFTCNFDSLSLQRNRWMKFDLKVDTEKGEITFSLGEHRYQNSMVFPGNSEFSLSLGVVNKYGFYIEEVPSMSIKDLAIHVDGNPKHLWPLRKTESHYLKDILSSRTAKLYNPDWVIDYHSKWTKTTSLTFPSIPSMAYNKQDEVVHFVLENGVVHSYSLTSGELQTISDNKGYPVFEKSQQLIIDNDNQIVSYSLNHNDYSVYEPNFQRWTHVDSIPKDLPKWWHHNKLIHPITNQITTLCGYGYYSYTNAIKSFDSDKKVWKELEFEGDIIRPRYCSSLGTSSANKNIVYLFGGLGNSLGKQILGKEFYYDLFKIDLEKNKIEKLWELNQDDQFQYLPVNSLKLTERDSSFYTLMFHCQKSKTFLQVAKGNINEPKIQFIGDSIPYEFVDIKSFADLYYWESQNKLIALTSIENEDLTYEVSMYTMQYEPGSEIDLNITKYSLSVFIKLFYILLASVIIFLIFYIRKQLKKKLAQENKKEEVTYTPEPELLPNFDIPQVNAILLFGGFQAYSNNGKDITYRFSPTLKELFLLILLNSLEDGKGISSRRIQEYLWPDKPESKAKNNRGVNIKKIRGIIEDIDGIEIVFDNNYWKINLEENVFCDLKSVQLKINTRPDQNSIKFEELISILNRGALLQDIIPEWLDSFKDKTTGLIVSTLESWITKMNLELPIRIAISNIIFEFDQMNETALKVKCSLLSLQGKHSLAMETYEHYKKLYLKLYNEEYQPSFKEIATEIYSTM